MIGQRFLDSTCTFVKAVLVVAALTVVPAKNVLSQSAPSQALVALIDKARAALDAGDGAFARNTLDSLVNALPVGSVDIAEALFWRAAVAESAADAERDWKRLLVESPLSSRAAEALVRLSELELLRGDRAASRAHAERLLMDHANSPYRGRAFLLVAKSWFGENNAKAACNALSQLDPLATAGELKLQHDELRQGCAVPAQADASTTVQKGASEASGDKGAVSRGAVKTNTAPAKASSANATDNAGRKTQVDSRTQFSVQLAAYSRIADANAMVKRLAGMNIMARVDGKAAPYRVRTGMYRTRAEAAEALAQFEKRGIKGFVAEITP